MRRSSLAGLANLRSDRSVRANHDARRAATKIRRRATIAVALAAMTIAACGPLCERAAAIDETFADRKAQFEKLTPTELADLGRKYERFQQLAPDKQQDLRKIHDGLTREGEGERLRGVLDRYHAWLQTLPAGQRAELLSLPPDERVARIKQIQEQKKDDEETRFDFQRRRVAPEDQTVMLEWLDSIARRYEEQYFPKLLAEAPQHVRERVEQTTDPRQKRLMMLSTAVRFLPEAAKLQLAPDEAELDRMAQRMSPEFQRRLRAAATNEERAGLFRFAAHMTLISLWMPTREELEKFYREEINSTDRDGLDPLPPDQFREALLRLYMKKRPELWTRMFPGRGMGGRGPGFPGSGNQGPGGERPGGPGGERQGGPGPGSGFGPGVGPNAGEKPSAGGPFLPGKFNRPGIIIPKPSEGKGDSKPDAKPESKPDPKPESKPESKPEPSPAPGAAGDSDSSTPNQNSPKRPVRSEK